MNIKPLIASIALILTLGAAPARMASQVRFTWVDVHVDAGSAPLVAWQVRLVDPSGRARIVGVEGGDDPVYADPPHYDPKALMQGEIILAAFHTGGGAPAGRTRVARVHLEVDGPAEPAFDVTLEVAASEGGAIEGARIEVIR